MFKKQFVGLSLVLTLLMGIFSICSYTSVVEASGAPKTSITKATFAVDEWINVYISSSYGGTYSWSIDNPGYAVSNSTQNGKVSIL